MKTPRVLCNRLLRQAPSHLSITSALVLALRPISTSPYPQRRLEPVMSRSANQHRLSLAGTARWCLNRRPLTSPSTVSLPAPPPARGSSRSLSGGKPPSVFSLDLSSNNTPNKRASVMAPPPPPPRHGRSSMDAQSPGNSQRPSGEHSRRSIESARRGSNVASVQQDELPEPANKHDILADLSKLQREIDALRQSETGRIT